ncbi:MAG: hypothetical protein JOZ83_11520 [Silvibacterium sp.]|nr:hypothetical protein [Silvibacterium sp.]
MGDFLSGLTEKLSNFAGKWTSYAAFGSFLLYLVGYLTLRFQLSTYGLATDLDLFDEKYLFAGCRFVVYLVSCIPSILILVLVLTAIGYLPYRLTPAVIRERLRQWLAGLWANPAYLAIKGIVLAVIFIQLVMRKCFAFGNLLLRKDLPDEWITSILLAGDGRLALYFSGLVAGTLLTALIAWQAAQRGSPAAPFTRFLVATLVFLVAVEFLLLPVNYGVLISTQQLPQVAELPADGKSMEGGRAWMVWNSKDSLTYFLYGPSDRRMLLTIPRKDLPVRIVAYDDIYCVLFSAEHSNARPCPR